MITVTAKSHSTLSDSTNDPLVTIAIPTFNRASLLKGCVASALLQTYQRFEVIVSDNASTDQTPDVLREFIDPKLRVVRQATNIGLIPNWNACLAEATGDYVVFVSDDDRIAPWMLERCIALVKSQPQLPIVIALSDVQSDAEGRVLAASASRKLRTGIWDGADILEEVLEGHIVTPMCTIMIRTGALRARGGFPIDWPHLADKASWVPLLLTGKAGLVNECCGIFCANDDTQTTKFGIDIILRDVSKLVDLITNIADHSIEDLEKSRKVKFQARRHFAHCAIYLVASRRRRGARFAEMLPVLWQYRRDLGRIGIRNVFKFARELTIVFLPRTITRWLRYMVIVR